MSSTYNSGNRNNSSLKVIPGQQQITHIHVYIGIVWCLPNILLDSVVTFFCQWMVVIFDKIEIEEIFGNILYFSLKS